MNDVDTFQEYLDREKRLQAWDKMAREIFFEKWRQDIRKTLTTNKGISCSGIKRPAPPFIHWTGV